MADLDLTKLREIAEAAHDAFERQDFVGMIDTGNTYRRALEPPTCPNHREVQHRDRKPPWCPDCGWNQGRPAVPPRQIDTRDDTDTEGTDHD